MGLETTHGCWQGAYSAFMRWRIKIAEVASLPPLQLMEGFHIQIGLDGLRPTLYHGINTGNEDNIKRLDALLPISWDCLKPDPLHALLHHSDCDGDIPADECSAIADRLEALLPLLPDEEVDGHIGHWRKKTQTFIDGLRKAAAASEPVEFY